MNPFNAITRPVKNLTDAITMPFRAAFVIGLTGFINYATFSGDWWFKWVAFVGWKIYQRYGAQARQRFDDWVASTQPQAAQVLQALRAPASPAAGPAR